MDSQFVFLSRLFLFTDPFIQHTQQGMRRGVRLVVRDGSFQFLQRNLVLAPVHVIAAQRRVGFRSLAGGLRRFLSRGDTRREENHGEQD